MEAEVSSATDDTLYRVKVYTLDGSGQWQDIGTGPIVLDFIEEKQTVSMSVTEENSDNNLLLNVLVVKEDIYNRQQETLIVWAEPDGSNFALSFQEPVGCNNVWDEICKIQRLLSVETVSLPEPQLSNLRDIEMMIQSFSKTYVTRDNLGKFIIESKYIEHLIPVFEECESLYQDLDSQDSLQDLFTISSILRSIIFLNEVAVFEVILNRDVFPFVVGMLEYDSEYRGALPKHREFLKNNVNFKQILPLSEPTVEKIQQTYRIQFLRDVVLARILDDSTFSLLSSFCQTNHLEILSAIQENDSLMQSLFNMWSSSDVSDEKRNEILSFLRELCGLAKSLQISRRSAFYRSLSRHGIFTVFDTAFASPSFDSRILAASVFSSIVEHDPDLVRSFILSQLRSKKPDLLSLIISHFLVEQDPGIKVMIDNARQDTLGPPMAPRKTMMNDNGDMDDFLNRFYDSLLPRLMEPLTNLNEGSLSVSFDGKSRSVSLPKDEADTLNHLCEILCFCVQRHTFRIKYYLLASKVSVNVAQLLRSKESYLRLSALRFIRACIGVKDEYYNRHFIKHDIFGPIISAFLDTKSKNNLFNSACLELFEFIRLQNLKSLISFITEKYASNLRDITYVDTFKLLFLRHEQANEDRSQVSPDSAGPSNVSKVASGKDGWSKVDQSEEDYFASEDESPRGPENISPTADDSDPFPLSTPRRLVNYDDDDDDDDGGLIVRKRKAFREAPISAIRPTSPPLESKKGSVTPGKKQKKI